MKTLYFSTFVKGLEEPVEAMLRREGGVAVERMLSGAALYKSAHEPRLPYMHMSFRVLFQMKPMASAEEALRRLLATGGWLDRFPYDQTQGLRFRIVTMQGDQLVSANMRYVDMLEKAICEQTGMRTGRERPDVELWVLLRPEAAYFLWRIGRTGRQDGPLRGDVCAVAASLAPCVGKNAAILGCTSAALAAAVKAAGVRTLTCVCPDRTSAALIENRVRGVRVCEGPGACTDLADASQSAVILYLPVKAEKTERLLSDLRSALFEARRVLEADGRLIVLASLAHAESTLRRTQGVRILARYDLTLSGQRSAIWVIAPGAEEAQ